MARFSPRHHSSTLRVAAAVAALAVTVPVGGSQAEVARPARTAAAGIPTIKCDRAKVVENESSRWQRFPAPTFSIPLGVSAGQEIISHAVDPKNPRRIAVTNGNSVEVSVDGGCVWNSGLRLDRVPSDPQKVPLAGDVTQIHSVYIAGDGAIFALAEDEAPRVGRPHVIVSRDPRGTRSSWQVSDTGLPPIGHPITLKGSTDGRTLYLSFSGAREEEDGGGIECPPQPLPCPPGGGGGGGDGQALGLLWRSPDGGRSWEAATNPQELDGATVIKYFSVDDDDPAGNMLWAVANNRLQLSRDGGRNFDEPAGLDQSGFTFTAVESINRGETPDLIKVVAFSSDFRMMRLEINGKWTVSKIRFTNVQSIAQRPEGEIVVATSPNGGYASVWRIFASGFRDYDAQAGLSGTIFAQTFGWESITPRTALTVAPGVSGGDFGRSQAGTVYTKTKDAVLRFVGSPKRGDGDPTPPTSVGAPIPPDGRITPRLLSFDLPPGGSRTVKYRLELDRSPTPLDLYLLLDNSASMLALISDLKESLGTLAQALVDSGVDVQVGVGAINAQPSKFQPPLDDPSTPQDEGEPRPLYKRLHPISQVDTDLYRELDKVDGNGGSGDEAQLEALWQAATGDGLEFLAGTGWLLGYDIEKDEMAGFRDELQPIKVIVHATNEKFSTNIVDGHNDPKEVGDKLKEKGILQIGLSQGVIEAERDLSDMARRTGALAPRAGVDCDGDGFKDISYNEPLVCAQNVGLDRTLLNLLDSISDRAVISLLPSRTETLRSISRTEFNINAKQRTDVTFTVTYSCAGLAPDVYSNDVTAGLRGRQVAKAVTVVTCDGPGLGGGAPLRPPGAQPGVSEPLQPQPPPQPQPALPGIAPINPIPQPQTQPQTQPQVNPQAGAAKQDQQQYQVAGAFNDVGMPDDREADQLSMSSIDYGREATPGMAVHAAGMMMATAVATGVALRRRTRTKFARQQVRR